MTDADKVQLLTEALHDIATLPDPGIEGRSAEGEYTRARILAKIALRKIGLPADTFGGSHGHYRPLHYKDVPPDT